MSVDDDTSGGSSRHDSNEFESSAKNLKESDRIRDELAAAGVLLEDQPGGKTLWRRG